MLNLPRKTLLVLLCGGVILTLSVGVRSSFGLFLRPMSDALGWGRETFAFAIALQNMVWGLAQPVTGAMADRYGSGRVVLGGAIAYAAGLYLMSITASPIGLVLSAGVLMGFALSATSFAVVLGAVGRAAPEAHRSMALGIASSLGSMGQFVMLPIGQTLISSSGWAFALVGMGLISLVMVPLSAGVAGRPSQHVNAKAMSMRGALKDALRHRGFILLFLGFFVCGFQVMFLATHLPAYIADNNLPAGMGATALATVGLFNIVGSYVWPMIAGRTSKSMTLAVLYLARAVVIGVFLMVPLSTASVLVFAAAIGFMWLATVPVTTALVGQIFGVRFVSTLFGIVFLGHQIGSFLGVWLGGYLYDTTGSYNVVWYLTIALGVVAALLHWPINETRVDWALAEEAA